MLHRALEWKMKNGSGAVKAHLISLVTSSACSSVVLDLRVSNGLNGCECKYSVVGPSIAAAFQGPMPVVEQTDERLRWVKTS